MKLITYSLLKRFPHHRSVFIRVHPRPYVPDLERSFKFLLLICLTVPLVVAQTPWRLVWSDEFNGAADTPPDPAKWNHDLGGDGWGNGEQEVYTNSPKNSFLDGHGHLVIRAIRDASGHYTSARLRTGKAGNTGKAGSSDKTDHANGNWQFGKIEARIKLPFGPGVWPAFWMLGSDIGSVGWPKSGEIDILENFGSKIDNPSTVHGTIHGPSYSGAKGIGAPSRLPIPETFTKAFHVFTVEWTARSVEFFVDGMSYEKLTPEALPPGATWAFDHPFFILLNLAIGGTTSFTGTPTPETPSPQDMLVDYVRVYARQ